MSVLYEVDAIRFKSDLKKIQSAVKIKRVIHNLRGAT